MSCDECVADRGRVVSHTWRISHLEPFDQPGKLAGERVLVVATDHDLDAAIGRGTSHLESVAEHHDAERVNSSLGFRAFAVGVPEPHLDAR
jgi:hypothetical protein